jgi:predicted trehalose synthase
MLRSFAYAASAARLLRNVQPPDDWEHQARERFLSGYLSTVDSTLLPAGQAAVHKLLSIFELEKAIYELRYEIDNRPEWIAVPVAGLVRLLEGDAV